MGSCSRIAHAAHIGLAGAIDKAADLVLQEMEELDKFDVMAYVEELMNAFGVIAVDPF